MKLTRKLVFLLCLAAGLTTGTALPASAADKWIRVTTEHFDTVGNTTDYDVRHIAQTLEHFHEVVTTSLLRGVPHSSQRAVVLVFKDDISFTPYKPQGAGKSSIGGLFFYDDDETLLALSAGELAYAFRVVLNGYSRATLHQTTGNVPLWVSTGLGELYQTFEDRNAGKGALIGRPDQNLVEYLRQGTIYPLSSFITFTDKSPGMTLGTRQRWQFDAQAWALMHYLTFGPRQDQLRQYLARLRTGESSEQAFRSAVGDLEQLERELKEYISKFAFPALQIVFDENVKPSLPPRSETLKEADVEAYLSSLLVRTAHGTEARTRLERAISASPDSPTATAALAALELSENKFERGVELMARAATLAPADNNIQAHLGHVLAYEVVRKGSSSTEDDVKRARAALGRAVELSPDRAVTLAELGWMLLYRPDEPKRAAEVLAKAVSLEPEHDQYRLWLADALLRDEEFDAGRSYLGPLMVRGSSPEIRSEARRLLGTVSDLQKRAASRNAGTRSTAPSASDVPEPPAVSTGTNGGTNGAGNVAATSPGSTSLSTPTSSSGAVDGFIPVFRVQQAGETRVLGLFGQVQCDRQGVTLIVESDGRTLKLLASQLSDVQFLSYRKETPRSVECGPIDPPQRVLATFRAGAAGADIAGTVVAIELLQDGYTPR